MWYKMIRHPCRTRNKEMDIKKFTKDDSPRVGVVVTYFGDAGSGKTFNALSFPTPMLIIDTECRCELVLNQQEPKENVYPTGAKTLKELIAALNWFQTEIGGADPPSDVRNRATIVIDSATALMQLAQDEYLLTTNAKKIWPKTEWGKVYARLDSLIHNLRSSGHNIVFTAQLRDEYVDDAKTGRQVMDAYKKLPYQSDIVVYCEGLKEEGKKRTVVVNGYGEEQFYEVGVGLEGLLETIGLS
jgi:hypothetical protein